MVWLLFPYFLCVWFKETTAQTIDFTPFHEAIKKAFDSSGHVVKTLHENISSTADSAECLMPKKGIMFTYANHYMMQLVLLQHRAMKIWDLKDCLESRFITICSDVKCLRLCNLEIKNCVLLEIHFPPTEFSSKAFSLNTFIKHDLMAEALKVADEVFFFDADVVLFRNPWIETTYGRSESGEYLPGPYDIMWQRDRGRGPGCSGTPNSGQLYIRNSTRAQLYFKSMQEMKPLVVGGSAGLDQDFVANATKVANMTHCALSGNLFTTHCLKVFGNIQHIDGKFPISKIISYHTACVSGMKRKMEMLRNMVTGVSKKAKRRVIEDFI